MCGIAGIIYRDGTHEIGRDMTRMLQSMKHRGPDSTGYALYRPHDHQLVMRYKLADANTPRDFEFSDRLDRNQDQVIRRLRAMDADIHDVEEETEYAYRVAFTLPNGNLKELADRIEDIPDAEVLSLGHSLEIVKDLGDAEEVADQYDLKASPDARDRPRPHGDRVRRRHLRRAPVLGLPFSDVAVVHNGQLTNYFQWKRRLERSGHRFQSECDSEIIAVYLAEKMSEGASLEDAMRESLEELDGVFTYIAVTGDALGVCKDEMAAKPLVLYEADDLVALASEEIAIRAVVDHEIDTYDPYEGEVMVWQR